MIKRDDIETVLDHGYVKLIDFMGDDERVIRAARQSTGKGFQGWDKDEGLQETLYRDFHMTPFEMGGELIIEVQAPIMVFREWHRHRTQSYNEFSARYAKMPDLHYLPRPERVQTQSQVNKQGSGEPVARSTADEVIRVLEQQQKEVYRDYSQFIQDGVAREVARLNTPVSRYSKMWAKGNLRNWLGFLLLRKAESSQWEIRQYADAVGRIIQQLWPRTYALFEEYDLNGMRLCATQIKALQLMLQQVTVERATAMVNSFTVVEQKRIQIMLKRLLLG